MSSTDAFPTAGFALQLEVSTVAQLEVSMVAVASIPGQTVGEKYWNSSLDDWLEAMATSIQLEAAVAATSEIARLQETLPTTSRVLGRHLILRQHPSVLTPTARATHFTTASSKS
jgi:hypothetical protein